jgi:putative DNA primase/helicase
MSALDLHRLARALGGNLESTGWISCPGPGHSKKDRSLSVKVDPNAEGGFRVESQCGDDWRECRDYVREKLGLDPWEPDGKRVKLSPEEKARQAQEQAEEDARREQEQRERIASASRWWNASKPAKGTLVERYLERRGLELPDTEAIRFHPRLMVTGTRQRAPGMVCRMTDIITGEFTGIHRTFLTDEGCKIDGNDFITKSGEPANAKTTLGRKRGSVIRIDANVTTGLAIAEGVESTIAARHLYRPAWCVVDAERLIAVPAFRVG